MTDTPTAKPRKEQRHEISFQMVRANGHVYIQASCCCDRFHPPPYWSRQRAEEVAHDHMRRINYNKKEGKL